MMDQITYVIHQLHYNIYLVYIFQLYNERVQSSSSDKDSNFVIFDHFDSISRLIFMMDIMNDNFQLTIMNECKVIHKQPPIRTQIL